MNVFEETDYRRVLERIIEERRRVDASVNFGKLAAVMHVPKSYLSRVIHGKADLNADQLYLALEYFALSAKEKHYLSLLLELARSSLPKRKRALLEEIKRIQRREFEVKEHLSLTLVDATQDGMADYYLDPINQIVHVALSVERYRQDLTALARDLDLPRKRILDSLIKLEQLGLIQRKKDTIAILVRNIHLPRESSIFRAWRARGKLMSFSRIETIPEDEAFTFSSVFSATDETRTALHAKILNLIRESEGLIKKAAPERVFQLGIDLFPWTNAGE